LAVYLVALTLIGVVVRRPGEASQVLVVPISGALTVLVARRLSSEPVRISRPISVVVAAVATVAIVFGITRLGDNPKNAAPSTRRGSLLLVAGVDTSTGSGALFRFDPETLGFTCGQTYYYSYRGRGRGGPRGDARCPIRTGARYQKSDTTRPLGQLASALHAQLAGLPELGQLVRQVEDVDPAVAPEVVVIDERDAQIARASRERHPTECIGGARFHRVWARERSGRIAVTCLRSPWTSRSSPIGAASWRESASRRCGRILLADR